MSRPRIAICVVTFNSADLIPDLVASLPAGAAHTSWELVVADNASTDGTVEAVRAHAPDAVIVETGANLGYAAGVNAAIRAAGEHDAYLVMNADVRLADGCARTLYAALSPSVGIVVPRLTDAAGALIWSQRREPTLVSAWADALVGAERVGAAWRVGEIVSDPRAYERAHPVDWAEGSTQLVGRHCLQVCGEWDESYFLYSEETEYDLRARERGLLTWYEPAAQATHLEGGSSTSPRQWSLLVANRVRLYARRHGAFASVAFWLAAVVRETSRAVLGRATSRAAARDLCSPARLRQARGPGWLAAVRV